MNIFPIKADHLHGNLYRIGKTLEKLLQYKDRWAWQEFYPVKFLAIR